MEIRFIKKSSKTLETGQITIPKEFDGDLDKEQCCPLGLSVDIRYILPNGTKMPGRLYQSSNNTTTYYQFYLVEQDDKSLFKRQMQKIKSVECKFVLPAGFLYIYFL